MSDLTPDEARERLLAKLDDTPQNRLMNLLVNCHRMTHRDAYDLLKFLGSSEDFAAGFVTWPAILAGGERAGKVARQVPDLAKAIGAVESWRLTDPEEAS